MSREMPSPLLESAPEVGKQEIDNLFLEIYRLGTERNWDALWSLLSENEDRLRAAMKLDDTRIETGGIDVNTYWDVLQSTSARLSFDEECGDFPAKQYILDVLRRPQKKLLQKAQRLNA